MSRFVQCHGVNGDLCLMQALLQAWQVGQGGHHASPQGSTDVTDASAYPVKVCMLAFPWGPHQSHQLQQNRHSRMKPYSCTLCFV